MAQVTFFHYIHQDTPLHKMDGRLKLLCLLLLTLSANFATAWQNYLIPIGVACLALWVAKLPVIAIFKDMKFFAVMIVIVFMMSSLHYASRLLFMMLISIVMAGTTPLITIKSVIEWYLRPVPFIPETRIATIINLTFVLIPLIFDNYLEMMNAAKARGIQLRKNPIKRIKFIVFPLLNRTFMRADELVHAMESRCYSEKRTRVMFKTNRADWLMLIVCIAVLILVIW